MTPSTTSTAPKVRGGLVGTGAALCAVCCAAPLMTLLGIGLTGAAATAFTLALAGIVFAVVVAVATVAAVLYQRRQPQRTTCAPARINTGPVSVELLGTRPEQPADRS